MDDSKFQCAKCLSAFHPSHKEHLEKTRKAKGCFGLSETVLHRFDNRLNFYTCVGNFVSDVTYRYYEMYNRYEKGILPYEGALTDQPNKIMEIFDVIEQHRYDKLQANKKRSTLLNRMKRRGK